MLLRPSWLLLAALRLQSILLMSRQELQSAHGAAHAVQFISRSKVTFSTAPLSSFYTQTYFTVFIRVSAWLLLWAEPLGGQAVYQYGTGVYKQYLCYILHFTFSV